MPELVPDAVFMAARRRLAFYSLVESPQHTRRVFRVNLLRPPAAILGNFLRTPTQKLRHPCRTPCRVGWHIPIVNQSIDGFGCESEPFFALAQFRFDLPQTQNTFHVRHQFGIINRLGHASVRSSLKASHPFGGFRESCRNEQDSSARGVGISSKLLAKLRAHRISRR